MLANNGSKLYYDFAESIKLAKKDRWGLSDDEKEALARKLGRAPTAGEITAKAVENDFQYLKDWCDDKWQWIGVEVVITEENGHELASESVWGVESCGDYWKELAAELIETAYKRALLNLGEQIG